ncbi:MAG: HK97 gp10 family phage protein [Clostridia bacterium]|nr:HK97 gp10 family phage protein [Clostridia bacterium]
MPKMTPKLPEELMRKLSRLGDKTDIVCEHALQEGAEIVRNAVAESLDSVIGHGTKYDSRSTGELKSSLGVTGVKQARDGTLNIKIGFNEPRSDGGSNAKIANVLEYGKPGQQATGFLKKAKNKAMKPATEKMKEVLEKEMNGI